MASPKSLSAAEKLIGTCFLLFWAPFLGGLFVPDEWCDALGRVWSHEALLRAYAYEPEAELVEAGD
jgi:hypothetical protein